MAGHGARTGPVRRQDEHDAEVRRVANAHGHGVERGPDTGGCGGRCRQAQARLGPEFADLRQRVTRAIAIAAWPPRPVAAHDPSRRATRTMCKSTWSTGAKTIITTA